MGILENYKGGNAMLQVKVIAGAIGTSCPEDSFEERLNEALCELQDFCHPIKSVSFYPVGKDPFSALGGVGMIVYDDDQNESL